MDRYKDLVWEKTYELKSKPFVCWNCVREISSNIGYYSTYKGCGSDSEASIYICHNCNAPNLFNRYGDSVIGIPTGRNIRYLSKKHGMCRTCRAGGCLLLFFKTFKCVNK